MLAVPIVNQRVGQEEENGEEQQPGESLRAVARHSADGVERHHRADQEEQHVEAAEMPAQLGLFLQRARRCLDHQLSWQGLGHGPNSLVRSHPAKR